MGLCSILHLSQNKRVKKLVVHKRVKLNFVALEYDFFVLLQFKICNIKK